MAREQRWTKPLLASLFRLVGGGNGAGGQGKKDLGLLDFN